MLIVAISGWKGSGKDTAADFLVKKYGFHRIGFADPLKDSVARQFDIVRSHCDLPEFKESPLRQYPVMCKDKFSENMNLFMYREFRGPGGEKPIGNVVVTEDGSLWASDVKSEMFPLYWTPRALCIMEGSTKRSADPDFWVKQAVVKASKNGAYVISDLRFRSEIAALKLAIEEDDHLVTVRINRFDAVESNDPSERDLDEVKFDLTLDNRRAIEDLYNNVNQAMQLVLGENKAATL